MNPIVKRRFKIIVYMTIYGVLWGAVAGGAIGMFVGVFALIIGAIYGLPVGALLGAVVGMGIGFICGLITLWFEVRSLEATREHRRTLFIMSVLPTLLLIATYYGLTANVHWIVLLPAMTLGVLYARFVSRRLLKEYGKRFVEN